MAPPRARELVVPGGRLHYEVAGAGPEVVLLHEGISDRRMWDREFALLARTHRLVRYDQRGYGGSLPATGPFSYVSDLRAVIDAVGFSRPVVVGPSIGSSIALDYALAHPGTLAGLVLMAPGPPSGITPEMIPEGKEALDIDRRATAAIDQAWSEGKVDQAIEYLRRFWAPALEGEAREKFTTMVRENSAEIFGNSSAPLVEEPAPPAVERLKTLRVPTLILFGDRDGPLIPVFAHFLARRIPGPQLRMISGGDHLLNLSRPDEFLRALTDFLAAIPARKS